MKDTQGAEFAMRVAHEAWRNPGSSRKPSRILTAPANSVVLQSARAPHASSTPGTMPGHPFLHATSYRGVPAPASLGYAGIPVHSQRLPYHADPRIYQGGHPHPLPPRRHPDLATATPAKLKATPPDASRSSQLLLTKNNTDPRQTQASASDTQLDINCVAEQETVKVTPGETPKSPSSRIHLNPEEDLEERQVGREIRLRYFGSLPPLTKTTALTILSYLPHSDVCKCTLVSKQWQDLSMEERLWKLPSHK